MRRTLRAAAATAVVLTAVLLGAGAAVAAQLPDGRGYELVTPDINNASISPVVGHALADGSAVQFETVDAPEQAESASPINIVVSRRGVAGWSSRSFSPPLSRPSNTYWPFQTFSVSPDLTQAVDFSDQPLAGGTPPSGANLYLRRADGTYVRLTTVGSPLLPFVDIYQGPIVAWTTESFSHVFFQPVVAQLPEDPLAEANPGNTYEWSGGELRLVGILPDGTPAPKGAVLAVAGATEHPVLDPVSADGELVLFNECFVFGCSLGQSEGPIYLRERGARTVDVSASQRTVEPDPNPPAVPVPVGVTADGSKVLFTSRSELTDDAYTGRSGGVATDAGSDLYSYDVASGTLTDLTVDRDPADAATGADVLRVYGATDDASYLYFVATGDLAPGATSGTPNLYVMHDGDVRFVAGDPGLVAPESFYVTPDGRHAAFLATGSPTGYDNTNPRTGTAERELFVYSYDEGALACASCRPDGAPPTGGTSIAPSSGNISGGPMPMMARTLSDDGGRAFFDSTDPIVPGASNGVQNVYEYEAGQVHLISPGDGASASTLIDASASGDDVFFATHDELVPHGQGRVSMVYDARVGAAPSDLVPIAECSGEACLEGSAPPPRTPGPGSGHLHAVRVVATAAAPAHGSTASVRVSVPGAGGLTIAGHGLRRLTRATSRAEVVRLRVGLTSTARRSLRRHGRFATTARVSFAPTAGGASTASVALRFLQVAPRDGRKGR